MFTSTVAVVIARPLDEVFAFVADARNRPLWDDSVESEELTSPEPIGVDTTLVYDLADASDGTSVHFSVTGRPSGPLRVLEPLIARRTQQNLDKGFARLKEVLERGPFPPTPFVS